MTVWLESLRRHTVVVADTGDIDAIVALRPQDATTNPSLIYKAAQLPRYEGLVEASLQRARTVGVDLEQRTEAFVQHLAVRLGCEILQIIPGRVSTEVDASYSFDTAGTVQQGKRLIELYEAAGQSRDRVLIKIAATWEGIRAAEQLERQGIHCNLTLLFGFAQAVACAEARVTLISPFVGRIYDWHRKQLGVQDFSIEEDPGVRSVTRIYNHYKACGYATEVMGASFRKVEQIVALAGCDLLTVSPDLLVELSNRPGELARRLSPEQANAVPSERIVLDEKAYRWLHNQDAMAVEKLSEGIRLFHADFGKLADLARRRLS